MAGTPTRTKLDNENIKLYIDILNDMVKVLEATKTGDKSFTAACKDYDLDARKTRDKIISLVKCKSENIRPLNELMTHTFDNYEKFYIRLVGSIYGDEDTIALQAVLPIDYKETIDSILTTITQKEQDVLRACYGLDAKHEFYDIDDIARKYRIARDEIKSIEERAIRKLRHPDRFKIIVDGISVYNAKKTAEEKALKDARKMITECYDKQSKIYCELLKKNGIDVTGLFDKKINDLNLSLHTCYCLKRADINKVGPINNIIDLLRLIETDDLKLVRNLGNRGTQEIHNCVNEMLQKHCNMSLSTYLCAKNTIE